MNREDLIQEGFIGLIQAADIYRPNAGTKFSTYAGTCIINSILEELRRRCKHTPCRVSLDEPVVEDENATLGDMLPDGAEYMEDVVIASLIVNSIVRQASELNRRILRKYAAGKTQLQIADTEDISQVAVGRRIIKMRELARAELAI